MEGLNPYTYPLFNPYTLPTQVEGLDEDNAQVILKLTLSGKAATVSQYTCKVVSEKEFKQYSKYLS